MRIIHLTAGAAGSYCGACVRDVNLARGLRARGHDAVLMTLYTPLTAEGELPELAPVFFGGVNVYLQQRFPLFRRTPRWVDWLLDRRPLLRWVSRFAVETRAEALGPMAVSMLRGEEGFQRKEVDRVVAFLRERRPDVVSLSNTLLSGLAPTLRRELGAAVVCSVQGEEAFVEALGEPWAEEAKELTRRNVESADAIVAPSPVYADAMTEWLAFPRERVHAVWTGIDAAPYDGADVRAARPFRIGFLSRKAPVKGLDLLLEAFRGLASRRPGEAVLAVAGQARGPDGDFWREQLDALRGAGLGDAVEDHGPLEEADKAAFLKGLHVYCLPSRVHERRAVAALEAMAAGAAVVAPRVGVFPELLELTGGGVLVEPEDPEALARAIESLVAAPGRAAALGAEGAAAVRERFTVENMARGALAVYEGVTETGTQVGAPTSPCPPASSSR